MRNSSREEHPRGGAHASRASQISSRQQPPEELQLAAPSLFLSSCFTRSLGALFAQEVTSCSEKSDGAPPHHSISPLGFKCSEAFPEELQVLSRR